ncbi:hypothetical protein HanIR_Chr15g0775541 [Helianthus annuus]|uniref:uncharacterized protein LOC110938477 n=1 Tax=Helianthus annuus TaxID=4232 RepID=UPI001652C268|nr:uncharacterized protein LOC110938477 [Helianthus annuus]KAJ0457597.1 hypothetical protein HanIR_Chr15g0775541 [Helianthus annuus]
MYGQNLVDASRFCSFGRKFVQHTSCLMDQLANLYQDSSMLTFEGQKIQGSQYIVFADVLDPIIALVFSWQKMELNCGLLYLMKFKHDLTLMLASYGSRFTWFFGQVVMKIPMVVVAVQDFIRV